MISFENVKARFKTMDLLVGLICAFKDNLLHHSCRLVSNCKTLSDVCAPEIFIEVLKENSTLIDQIAAINRRNFNSDLRQTLRLEVKVVHDLHIIVLRFLSVVLTFSMWRVLNPRCRK